MRARNFIRNTKYSLLMQVIILVMGIIVPKLIIETYGSSVNGLKASITQILNVLNLMQAGLLGAAIFSLYEPLAKNDFKAVSKVMKISRKYFQKIGGIFLLLTLVIAPIATYNVIDTDLEYISVLFSFIILGVNASMSYFLYPKYDVIFSADQKRYRLSISIIIERISYFILLLIIITTKIHFIYMYIALFITTLVKMIYLEFQYRKLYKNRIQDVEVSKNEKIENRHYVMITQISTQAITLSPILLITFYFNLKYVSVYSIYNLIQSMILMILTTVYSSVAEVFGNLVASKKREKTQKVFNLLNWLYTNLGAWLVFCTIILLEYFVKLYTKNVTDMNYIIPNLDVMIGLNIITFVIYLTSKNTINAFGLFKEISKFSLGIAIVSLVCSTLLAKFSLPFVLIGPILFNTGMFIYSLIIIKRSNSWLFIGKIIQRLIPLLITTIVAIIFKQTTRMQINSWSSWMLFAFIVAIVGILSLGCYGALFEKRELKEAIGYLKSLKN